MPNNSIAIRADIISTLAVAALCLLLGNLLCSRAPLLRRFNLPPAVVGGAVFAVLAAVARPWIAVDFDESMRLPLQMAFFAAIGFHVTTTTLRAGGRQMVIFWLIACGTAVVQNAAGVAAAGAMGLPPAIGVLCGSATLVGGPATGMAFADSFTALGVRSAAEVALAAATFGICVSSLIGNPVATRLLRRRRLPAMPNAGQPHAPIEPRPSVAGAGLTRTLITLALTLFAGALIGRALTTAGVLLPAVIGPMIVAAAVRWIDERWRLFHLDLDLIATLGSAALAFFLAVALAGLKLWMLAELAGPLLVLLLLQTAVTTLYCIGTTWISLGRDYEAAVMTSGHIGFALGITANAVANMEALVRRHGPAPRAFLIVPAVGGFFVDFANSLLIAAALGMLR